MTDRRHRPFSRLDAATLLAALPLAVAAAAWADRDYLVVNPPSESATRLTYQFYRACHDAFLPLGVATLAAAFLILRHPRAWRRGLTSPGGVAMAVAVLVGGFAALEQWIVGQPSFGGPRSLSFDLRNRLEFQVPGAILGAWAFLLLARLRRPRRDWRDRLGLIFGCCWLGVVGLLVASPLVFG